MIRDTNNSALAFALLGLIWQQPRSGYDLRKFFSSTPMISFSDSPGAIYPALHRLERRGYVRGGVERGPRRRRIFRMTARGRSEFKRWLAQPVTRHDVIRNANMLMLRFAFMDQFGKKGSAARFLRALHGELLAYIPGLREYLRSNQEYMPDSGRLALESGIQSYEAQLRWSKSALAIYQDNKGEKR